MMVRDILREEIKKAIKKLFNKEVDFSVDGGGIHADYSSNIAMVCAKVFNKNSVMIADEILAYLSKSAVFNKYFSQFSYATTTYKGGVSLVPFLNFWLKDEIFVKNISEILKTKEKYGFNKNLKNKKIIVEYTDPNPFKEFHIGHLMSNVIGESIVRLYEAQSAVVKRACYQGDVGLHVAKAIWGMEQDLMNIHMIKLGGKVSIFNAAKLLGRWYAIGAQEYERKKSVRDTIESINRDIYFNARSKNPHAFHHYDIGREFSFHYFEAVYGLLGMKKLKNGKHFDYYFFESETGKSGKAIAEKFLKKGIFEKSEGAVIFPEEKSGLHTRVFINSEGLPTYEAKELGLAEIKYKKYKYNTSIIITGNEIDAYFEVLLKAIEFIFPEIAKKTKHLSHGMLRLPSGKMSSRTGNVIAAMDLLDDIRGKILGKITDKGFSEKEKSEIAELVSLAAIKYSILKQSIGKDIIFDFDKSISFEGDSGPYIQYTYVRTQSILKKAKEEKISELKNIDKVKDIKISEVERLIQKFPGIVGMAAEKYAPNYICSFLIDLCHVFNSYYEKNKIVSNDDIGRYRIALTKAVGIVLKNGLNLLGISAPERM